jgi:acyl carrier protein
MKMTPVANDALTAILREAFPLAGDEFQEEWGPEDVEGWDSLAHLNLTMAVGMRFNIEMDFEVVMGIQTIGDVVRLVEQKGKP